jgi:8-oxo-dGTP diphosphatase
VKKYGGKTATAIIPYPEDKILLIKRDTVPFKGYWALPGGRMDSGEIIEQTCVREVKEETGLEVIIIRKVGEYHEPGIEDDIEYDYYPTCFVVKVVGGEAKKQDSEIEDMTLFNLTDLPSPLAFKHREMIDDYLKTR